jgi:hypothetical protein
MEMNNSLGSWAFILGVLIAIIAGLAAGSMDAATMGYMAVILVVLGLVVGFLNIGAKEVTDFLIAAIALVAVGAANLTAIPWIGAYFASMVLYIAAFVAPAALIVALKAIYNTARTPAA